MSSIEETKPPELLPPAPSTEQVKGQPFTLMDYLDTERGHEIAKTLLDLWKEIQKATLGSKSEQTIEQLKTQSRSWRMDVVIQSALASVVIVSAVVLAWHGKMDATITGFLGVALGYVLGKKTS